MSNFEAQSHSLFSRCLRLATTITGSHPRLATGGWLDLTRQAFHLLDYSPLSGRTIPIALLTAKGMEMDIVKGLESGADDYITKPFSLMVLRARIRMLLRRNTATSEQEYKNSVFLFRFETMEFYKNGVQIELSKTEQRILYLLISNPNRILTRERLLEWVWPEGTEYVEDNALSVGIRRLRDKLEDDSSNPTYIKTVYGKGYVWESV